MNKKQYDTHRKLKELFPDLVLQLPPMPPHLKGVAEYKIHDEAAGIIDGNAKEIDISSTKLIENS